MLDHITIYVRDLTKSKKFYDRTLAPLGMKIVLGSKREGFWGYGVGKDPYFEIAQCTRTHTAHRGVHIAFKAKNHKAVDLFHKAAITAGAKDNGQPGPRPNYTPTYYAAFVKDWDQNNVEACFYV